MKGGSDIYKSRSWWCSNCRKKSMTTWGPFSTSRRGGAHPLLKVAMSMAMLVLLFSIYQSCVSHDSTLPVWLSLSFVSRPSFLLSSTELSQQPRERPAAAILHPTPAISLPLQDSFDSSLVEPVAPVTLDPPQPPTLAPLDYNTSVEGIVVVQIGDKHSEKSDNFAVQVENFRSVQQASKSSDSGVSPQEKNSFPIDFERTQPATSSFDSGSPSVDTVSVKEIESRVISGKTSTVGAGENKTNGGRISEVPAVMKEPVDVVLLNNLTRPGSIASSNGDEIVPHETPRDDDALVATSPARAVPFIEPGVPQADPTSPSTDIQLTFPPQIMEKRMEERRVKLDQGLLVAKQAIEATRPADSDPSLDPVIYRNVSAFSKSYKLMEEMFRVYVYREGDKQLVHTGPLLGIYASEGRFIDRINRGSSFVEQDPDRAHMFFLPYSVTQMTLTIYVEGSHSMQPLNTYVKDYVNEVAAKYPFWNRTQGADHFFVSCHDWGPATARDHAELRTNAVKVVCNADLTEEYVVGKDASLPEIYLHNHKPTKVGGPGASRRSYLAFFAGQMHGHVRPVLIEHWKDKDPDMKIYEVLPKNIERKMNYVQHMKNSKYCICASGFEVNSPRIVESIYYDCVPVIIADNFVLPFSDVLNWNAFSVTVPESEIPNLKSILLSISDKQYRAMQKRLSKVRQHFLWNDQPLRYDVFHMILHSVWMSRLNQLNL